MLLQAGITGVTRQMTEEINEELFVEEKAAIVASIAEHADFLFGFSAAHATTERQQDLIDDCYDKVLRCTRRLAAMVPDEDGAGSEE